MRRPRWPEWIAILFVAAILAICALPVYSNDGRHNPAATCVSHLKQLAIGALIYSEDYDNRMPPRDTWLINALSRNHLVPGIDHCPLIVGPGLSGYSLNAGVRTTKDGGAASTPLIYDSVNLAMNASDLANSMPVPGRHKGKNCVAYADGHARSVESTASGTP